MIYDFKDGGGSLGLISLLPDEIPEEDKSKFLKIGVEIPSMKYVPNRTKVLTIFQNFKMLLVASTAISLASFFVIKFL